jgi:hypothetical protein
MKNWWLCPAIDEGFAGISFNHGQIGHPLLLKNARIYFILPRECPMTDYCNYNTLFLCAPSAEQLPLRFMIGKELQNMMLTDFGDQEK